MHQPVSNRRADPGPDPLRVILWLAVALLAAAVIGTAVYKAWPILFPPIAERAPLNPACDVTRADCSVHFGDGGRVQLAVRPRGIPAAQPLTIDAWLTGLPRPERVELDFAGVDMDMGYNRVTLTPSPDQPGHYTGRGMLPICVRHRMTWEARVLLRLPHGTLAAPFRFDTSRQGTAPSRGRNT
ncbi:MAG: hypothetical protein LJE69_20540 [Thiohalocapsa sp.]|jgi:hypothetical protein|uniref:hypothetical protein n=1 Tax=Thiohalocapsa sp. TaxID=2497641 RepID=UPI0025E8D387|nr:hypothetical protein [Thiohalocapsa sp.]MCG6943626.1 hypothetical protein [Thiohalocapsa sp.]